MTGRVRADTTRHRSLVLLALLLLTLVALSRPHAAKPDLGSGWPLDGLLPLTLSPAGVTALLWSAYAVGGAAVALALWRPVRPTGWGLPVGLGVLALVAAPMGSGDHLNYAAYGRILLLGGDPWTASPADFAGGHDPITSAVEEPWRTEPSVYGPFVTLVHAAAAAVGGTHLRLVVLAWQVVVVAAWLLTRWCLRRLVLPEHWGRVDALWTLNPLVVSVGLLGAHVDTVAVALVLLALVALGRRSGVAAPVAAGVLVALAAGTKFTYGVALLALALALVWRGRRGTLAVLAGFVAVFVALHAWTGGHVYDQVGRSRGAVSLASPWRPLLEWGRGVFGGADTRTAITVAASLLMVGAAGLLWRATRPATTGDPAVRHTGDGAESRTLARRTGWITLVLSSAYALLAPYSLPWYDLLPWALLPLAAPSVLDAILLVRLVLIAAAYVPGRVLGMTAGVEELTLGFRREVMPWLQLALWVAAAVLLVRRGGAGAVSAGDAPGGSGRSRGSGRPAR